MLLAGTPIVLNALVINSNNQAQYTNASGNLSVTTAHLAGKDALVIEGIFVSTSSGDAISVNLSNIALKRLAIESVNVSQFSTLGLNIQLTNVSGLESVAIEDVSTVGPSRGLNLTFDNTDTNSLTIDDSTFPGVTITARNGADVNNGVVTGNRISAPSGIEGIVLNVLSTPPTLSAPGLPKRRSTCG